MEENTYIPQPKITISQNIVTITSLAPVKFTVDGSDPLYYGLLYSGPFSINTSTVIKAVAFNNNNIYSELAVGSFTPETNVPSGQSDSQWSPVTYAYILNPSSGGGSADLSDYTTYAYVSAYYTTYSYLESKQYITLEDIPEVDLSSYVTYDFLSSQSYLTSVPNTYPTYTAIENMAYITMADVSACGYITASDIPSVVVPVVDENLIPKETATYTLGDADHLYVRTYTGSIQSASGGLVFRIGNSNTITIGGGDMRPNTDGGQSLGRSSNHWNNGYINNIYSNISYSGNYYTGYNTGITSGSDYGVQMFINGTSEYQWNLYQFTMINNNYRNQCSIGASGSPWAYTYTNYLCSGNLVLSDTNSIENVSNTRINFKVNQNNRCKLTNVEFAPIVNNGINLGTSSEKFNRTYTSNLYADNAYISNYNNFIWVGTAAQYAALSDYNTYQFYLVQES